MKINGKKYMVWLMVGFVLVFIYTDPDDASTSIGSFLGTLGTFFVSLLDSGSEFVQGLAD